MNKKITKKFIDDLRKNSTKLVYEFADFSKGEKMTKKIIHDEAREILNKIYYYYPDIPRQYDLEEYFKQQEKKAQLLELSLRLNEVWKQRYEYTNSANTIKDLENQISDLMKEIKVGQI